MYDGLKHSCLKGDHIVNIFSFSKAYGMMGCRVGYMKDYIATPKPNSYQIFHTIVILFLYESMFRMEVQIRTREMNLIGERGVVAHYSGRGFVTDLVGHTVANSRSSGGKIVCPNFMDGAFACFFVLIRLHISFACNRLVHVLVFMYYIFILFKD